MRKSVAAGIAIAVAAGALGAAPFASGYWVEQGFRANLKAYSGHPQVDFQLVDYKRGWTSSRATSRLTLHAPEQAVSFRLHHEIEHGPSFTLPALARVTTTPTLTEEKAPVVAHYFGEKAPLKSVVKVGLTGTQYITLSSPSFQGPAHNNEALRVEWQGLSGKARVSRARDRVRLDLSAPGLRLSGEGSRFALGGLAIKSQMSQRAKHLWLGDSHVELAETSMDLPNPEEGGRIEGHARGITGDSTFTRGKNEGSLRMEAGWGFDKAKLNGRSFSDGAFTMELRNIDQAAYRELQERASRLQAKGLPQEELAQANLALFRDLAPRFLARSPRLKITRLSLETDRGGLEGTAEAAYRGDPEAEQLPPAPALLLQRLNAHARLSVDKGLLKTLLRATAETNLAARKDVTPEKAEEMAPRVAQMRLGMLQGMGILVAENDHFTVEASWEEGSVTVNGRPLGTGMGGQPGAGTAPMQPGGEALQQP